MTIKVTDYVDLREHLKALNCPMPETLALLPDNLETAERSSALLYRGEATTIAKLFKRSELSLESVVPLADVGFIHNKSHDWAMPALFIGAGLVSENPNAVAIAINLISSYLFEYFRGTLRSSKVKLDVVVEKTPTRIFKRITYDGDVAGLDKLVDAINRVVDE